MSTIEELLTSLNLGEYIPKFKDEGKVFLIPGLLRSPVLFHGYLTCDQESTWRLHACLRRRILQVINNLIFFSISFWIEIGMFARFGWAQRVYF
jgi:hypothetical protein